MGLEKQPLVEVGKHMLMIVVAYSLATGPYHKKIYEATTDSASHLTACLFFAGIANLPSGLLPKFPKLKCKGVVGKLATVTGATGPALVMYKIFEQDLKFVKKYAERIENTKSYGILAATVMYLKMSVVTMSIGYYAMAKIGLGLLFAVFPIMILLYAFKGPMRQMFQGWLKVVFYYLFLQIVVTLVLVMIFWFMLLMKAQNAIIVSGTETGSGTERFATMEELYVMSTLTGMAIMFLYKASSLAGALSGSLAMAMGGQLFEKGGGLKSKEVQDAEAAHRNKMADQNARDAYIRNQKIQAELGGKTSKPGKSGPPAKKDDD